MDLWYLWPNCSYVAASLSSFMSLSMWQQSISPFNLVCRSLSIMKLILLPQWFWTFCFQLHPHLSIPSMFFSFNRWRQLFSTSNSGFWSALKMFSLKSCKILIIDWLELWERATYRLKRLRPPIVGQLGLSWNKQLICGLCYNVNDYCG